MFFFSLHSIEDDLEALLKVTDSSKTKPTPAVKTASQRPALAPKPAHLRSGSTPKAPPGGGCVPCSPEEGPGAGALDAADIIKYIRSSSTSAEADLDLFS